MSINKKNTYTRLILIVLVCVFFVGLIKYTGQNYERGVDNYFHEDGTSERVIVPSNILTIHTSNGVGHVYKPLIADTPELREKGLSGRASIDVGEAMLFIFEKSARNYFWMKDMLFSIDIVWLDTDKKVIHIEKNVSPGSFPKSFGPNEDSKYVLEFKEGVTESIGLEVGDRVEF